MNNIFEVWGSDEYDEPNVIEDEGYDYSKNRKHDSNSEYRGKAAVEVWEQCYGINYYESNRTYEKKLLRGREEYDRGYYGGEGEEKVTYRMYVDDITGLLVGDVGKFERWITKLEGGVA